MAPKEQNVEPVFINANGPFRRIMAEVKEKMAEKRDRAILYGSTAFLALVLPFALSSTLQQETIIKDVKPETSRGGVPMFVFQNVISKTKQTDKTYVAPNIDQYLQTDTQAKNSIQKVPPKQVETEMAFQEAGWLIPGKVGTVAEYLLLSAVVLAAAKGLIKRTPAYTRAEAAFHQDLASQFSNMMDQAYVSNPYLQGQLDNQLTELINHNPKYARQKMNGMQPPAKFCVKPCVPWY